MVTCAICNHEHRVDIESAIADASATYGDNIPGEALRAIADEFNISLNDLKVHMLMHMPSATNHDSDKYCTDDVIDTCDNNTNSEPLSSIDDYCDESEAILVHNDGTVSLSKQMKLREADMLLAVANEYFKTLQTVGKKINSLANKASDGEIDSDVVFSRLITKPMVDLYIGTGEQIRSTIKTIADVNQIINGDNNNGANAGLVALAEALKSSSATSPNVPNVLNFTNVEPDGTEKNSTQFVVSTDQTYESGHNLRGDPV